MNAQGISYENYCFWFLSGIGRAITQTLLDLGYFVIGLARDHSKFKPNHSQYFPYSVDFIQIHQAEKILKQIHRDHPDIEVIIGNAGVGRFGCLEQFSLNQIRDLVNVNFIGQALLIKTFLPSMKKQQNGKIILMGSESALSGARQGTIYCATKFALRGFAQSLREECQSAGIGVTLINPGTGQNAFF